MNLLLTVTLALSATFTSAGNIRSGGRQLAPAFPSYSQQCRDDAGPPFMDDSETFGKKKYHNDKPATAVGDCPDALKGACASKPKTEAFLEGPIDCGGRGWFCRILEEPGWNPVALTSDVNFGYCNTTEGYEDEGWDKSGHCHGSDADETFYWWVRDHWHRGYNGRLRCCCGWEDQVKEGLIVNRCDHRRLVTEDEDLEKCRDANEEGSKPYNGGCSPNNSPALNKPIPEDDAQCWEVSKFGEPEDGDEDENDSEDNDSGDNDDEDEDEDESEDEDNDNDSEDNDNESEDEDEDESEDEDGSGSGSEDDEECSDDTSFAYKGKKKKNCSWVGKKQSRIDSICPKKSDGKLVSESCPATCGTCSADDEDEDNDSEDNDSEDNDNESEDEDEDESEDEDEDEECSDDTSFAYKGKKKKNCSWVGEKQSRIDSICPKKSDGKLVSESCPATCGTCSTDDEDEDNDSEDNDNESEDEDEDEDESGSGSEDEDEDESGSGSEDEDEDESGSGSEDEDEDESGSGSGSEDEEEGSDEE